MILELLPEFKSPQRLWSLLALPVLIILYLLFMRLRGRFSMRFTNTGMLGAVMGSQRRWTRHLAVAMSLASLVALSLAWAEPLGKEKVPRERATVVMVLDTSLSMQAKDVEPDRLTAAKEAAKNFAQQLPSGYNVALVELTGKPTIKMPPSTDRGALVRAIDALDFNEGTALGEAIEAALNAVEQAPEGEGDQVPAMIVMLSDGTNTDGAGAERGVGQAKSQEIPVFTIAYGTDNGYVDLDGKRENVAPDRQALEQIAKDTGGRSVDAKSADSLADAYREIGSSVGYEEVSKPITAQYAFWALGFAVIAVLGALMMAARWPR